MRQPLGQPALDSPGGDDDEILGERVRGRAGQQFPQSVREDVGSLRAVDVQGHLISTLDGGSDKSIGVARPEVYPPLPVAQIPLTTAAPAACPVLGRP